MTVVADTSCLTTLLKAGCFDLIPEGFHPVLVPPAVWEELTVFHVTLPAALRRWELADQPRTLPQLSRLGRGEVDCILLALAVKSDLMLCDDQRANRFARGLGIRTLGTLGVALWARVRDGGGATAEEKQKAEKRKQKCRAGGSG